MNFTKRQENLPYQDFTQFKITRKMKDYKITRKLKITGKYRHND